MENPTDRLTTGVSLAELERRWGAVRAMMAERKIDFLVMRGDDDYFGGYVKWFSGFSPQFGYPFTVVFPADEEMTLITCSARPPGEAFPPKWAVRGVKQRLGAPYFSTMNYTATYDAELAVEVLGRKRTATIGLVGPSLIPIPFFDHLSKALPGTAFVDATDGIDRIKAVKSDEEVTFIRKTAAIEDEVIEHLRGFIRPGLRDFEILAEAQRTAVLRGSERQLILVGSGPPGTPVRFLHRQFQNRLVREGDQVTILVEVNGPGGFYAELGRVFSIGRPSQEMQDAFGVALEAQEITLRLLRPGARPSEMWDEHNRFLEQKGYAPETRLYAHGQGYDLVERPALRNDETMEILSGMNITVHPVASTETVWVTLVDNYIVSDQGVSGCLQTTPKEIIVL